MKKNIKKEERLRLKSDFDYVRKNGIKFIGRTFILVLAKHKDNNLKCGVICSRKFNKRAVKRNRARRLLWESFRLIKESINPAHFVLITRKWIADKKQQDVQKEMEYLLKKAKIWQDSPS